MELSRGLHEERDPRFSLPIARTHSHSQGNGITRTDRTPRAAVPYGASAYRFSSTMILSKNLAADRSFLKRKRVLNQIHLNRVMPAYAKPNV